MEVTYENKEVENGLGGSICERSKRILKKRRNQGLGEPGTHECLIEKLVMLQSSTNEKHIN